MNILSNRPFLVLFSATSVCCIGAWKSTIGPGAPKSADATVWSGSFRSKVCSV